MTTIVTNTSMPCIKALTNQANLHFLQEFSTVTIQRIDLKLSPFRFIVQPLQKRRLYEPRLPYCDDCCTRIAEIFKMISRVSGVARGGGGRGGHSPHPTNRFSYIIRPGHNQRYLHRRQS